MMRKISRNPLTEQAVFSLPQRYAEAIVEHAKAENPNECCGILAGKEGQVVHHYQVTNAEASPYRYNMEPRELLRIMRELDEKGWELLAIYHSHTFTPAHPSQTDVALAFYPEAYYILVSLMEPSQPELRAYRIVQGEVREEPLKIVEG